MVNDFGLASPRVSLLPGSECHCLSFLRYGEHAKLVGILYLHRITDPRVNGSGANNLHVLISLCGMSEMPNVVLVTTFWGQIESQLGEQREAELKRGFWKQMLEQGCKIVRFKGGHESAFDIVTPLLSNERVKYVPSGRPVVAKCQTKKSQIDVLLGSNESPDGELKRLERENKDASNRRRELVNQPRLTPEVQAEVKDIEKKILITSIQLRISGSPLVQWFRRFFKRK
jgi:hypothetical protein